MEKRPLVTLTELANIYGKDKRTVVRMIGTIPLATIPDNEEFYDLNAVTQIIDVNKVDKKEGWKNQWGEYDPDEEIETDPNKMKAAERRLWFQSEDLRQSTMLKERKNATEARELIPVREVEIGLAAAFKAVALVLDTLPDALERDGVIPSSQINTVIKILDSSREQLVQDLLKSSLKPVGDLLSMMVNK